MVQETLSQKYPSQKGLVEWLKVKALRSSPNTAKEMGGVGEKKRKERERERE
jgi:hypothetical protein